MTLNRPLTPDALKVLMPDQVAHLVAALRTLNKALIAGETLLAAFTAALAPIDLSPRRRKSRSATRSNLVSPTR